MLLFHLDYRSITIELIFASVDMRTISQSNLISKSIGIILYLFQCNHSIHLRNLLVLIGIYRDCYFVLGHCVSDYGVYFKNYIQKWCYDKSNGDHIFVAVILSKAIIYEPRQSKSARIDLNVKIFLPFLPFKVMLVLEII